MIGNLLNVLVGLWLAYSAIFSTPAGNADNALLAGAAAAVVVLAVWARQSDAIGWQSATNMTLGGILLFTAAVRWASRLAPLLCFWIILLSGIVVSILALWSMLYRPARSGRA